MPRVRRGRGRHQFAGNGVGAVVLKRLEDALEARDTIVAVIRGAAINNDGAAKIGYTAPSIDGQAEVVALAQGLAGVAPDSIGYVEAHGTGTPLGDPVELAALTRVFTAQTRRRQFCAIGSVKTNIGHLDAAAGVAGLIKAALAVQHGVVPPSLHFDHANPNTRLDEGPFFVPTPRSPAAHGWTAARRRQLVRHRRHQRARRARGIAEPRSPEVRRERRSC